MKKVSFIPGFMGERNEGDFLKSIFSEVTTFDYPNFKAKKIQEELLSFLNNKESDVIYAYSMGGRILLSILEKLSFTPSLIILESVGINSLNQVEAESRLQLDRERSEKLKENHESFLREWYQLPLWNLSQSEFQLMLEKKNKLLKDPNQLAFWAEIIVHFSPGIFPKDQNLEEILLKNSKKFPFCYLVGREDSKYLAISNVLKGRLSDGNYIKSFERLGHNLHFQDPDTITNYLKSLDF